MPKCTTPQIAWLPVDGGPLAFKQQDESTGEWQQVTIPCNKCHHCKMNYARDWSTRAQLEMQFHKQSSFLTLTYDDDHLPDSASLEKRDYQLFMKRYRKHLATYEQGKKIRYLACGEYGERLGRPHYHALIFGHQFDDLQRIENAPSGEPQYQSETLNQLWGKGRCTIGEANGRTANYIAAYVSKKQTGYKRNEAFGRADLDTGEWTEIEAPGLFMSRMPGIGARFYENFKTDVFPSDELIIKGKRYPVPPYYYSLLKQNDPELFAQVRDKRVERGQAYELVNPELNTAKRRLDKELISIKGKNEKPRLLDGGGKTYHIDQSATKRAIEVESEYLEEIEQNKPAVECAAAIERERQKRLDQRFDKAIIK